MIFTSSKEFAINELSRLNIVLRDNIKVTVNAKDAIDFLTLD